MKAILICIVIKHSHEFLKALEIILKILLTILYCNSYWMVMTIVCPQDVCYVFTGRWFDIDMINQCTCVCCWLCYYLVIIFEASERALFVKIVVEIAYKYDQYLLFQVGCIRHSFLCKMLQYYLLACRL